MGREGLGESKDPAKRVGSRLNDRGGKVENNVTSHFPVTVSSLSSPSTLEQD